MWADIGCYDNLGDHFCGQDTVVHLAADARPSAPWDSLLANNITGTRNVLEAAAVAGCRRVVLASSLHAVQGYPLDVIVRADMPPGPANLYGATKAWAESLGSYYAHARGLSVLCVRIGWLKEPHRLVAGDPCLDRVITPRDVVQLLACCIDASDDLRYGVFHGLSNNRTQRFDLVEAREALGYEPEDNAFALASRNYGTSVRRWVGRVYRVVNRCTHRSKNL